MSTAWIFALLLLHPFSISTLSCNRTDHCTCFEGTQTEIQCPPLYDHPKGDRIIIHAEEKETTKIDCYKFKKFRMDLLPNVTISKASRLEMHDCPLPPKNFKQILDHFAMTKVKVFHFEKSCDNVTLTKQSFEGFGGFERLKLNRLNFTSLSDDVFSEMSNLYSLEMESNRNLTLVSNLFKDLTSLNVLYLANNGIEVLPGGIFDNLTSLRILHLWGNKLKEIKEDIFANLTNLTSLELKSNEIETVSGRAFQNLIKLKSINLSGNRLTSLSPDIFRNNRKIEVVYFNFNPELQPPDYLLANLQHLQQVDLSNCNLSWIPEHIFENSTSLTHLSLGKNYLGHLSPILFRGLANLKSLDLFGNVLTYIDKDTFKDLTGLEKIDLQKNNISTMDSRVFFKKEKLKSINLAHNLIAKGDIIQESPSVKILNLSYNRIEKVEDVVSPFHVQNLEDLDLSNNLIDEIQITDLPQPFGKIYINLDNNKISRVHFENIEAISGSGSMELSLAKNPINCDCYSYELFQFLRKEIHTEQNKMLEILTENLICESPPKLKNQNFTELAPSQIECSVEAPVCPSNCICSFLPYTRSIFMDCSFKNLTELPIFDPTIETRFTFNQTEMNLKGNKLLTGPRKDLEGYDNVTKLDLSKNMIEEVEWLPPKLEVLHLDNNHLKYVDSGIFKTLKTSPLINLTLGHNPWSCDCAALPFSNFLRENSKLMDAINVKCKNSSTLLLNLSEKELCPDKLVPYIVVPILTIILLITTILVFFFRYQEEIKIWLFAHNLCLFWVTEEDLDKDKTYDAFISYSQKDEDFVVQNLLPNLEGGQNPYKLCLHYRNWVPGEMITTQITNSVLDSRRTLVVLSKNFLESVWGKMEFRTAHTHAMTEGRARVIIVLYGDIEIDKLDEELKSYLKTNTYVKWEDPYFWNKLRYALPHSKRKVKSSDQKLANVMRCIDDKFNLVIEDKSSPGTTPPVLSLNGDALKKHPLSFVHCQEFSTPPAEAGGLVVSTYS